MVLFTKINECRQVGTVASPYVGGLGGSAPLLVRFLGASEKMNEDWGLGVSPRMWMVGCVVL